MSVDELAHEEMTVQRMWKVGELAKRTGISVRTLHHYDAIGLLVASRRTGAGHRLYTTADVARLQQIMSLRALGLPLEQIGPALDVRGFSPAELIRRQIGAVQAMVQSQQKILRWLEAVAASLERAESPSVEDLLDLIAETCRMDTYYTPEQQEAIRKRGEALGTDGIRKAEADWQTLMDEVQKHIDAGTDPGDPLVQALAAQWKSLVQAFTGGDPGITKSLGKMWQQETTIHGIDTGKMRAMMAYIGEAGGLGSGGISQPAPSSRPMGQPGEHDGGKS